MSEHDIGYLFHFFHNKSTFQRCNNLLFTTRTFFAFFRQFHSDVCGTSYKSLDGFRVVSSYEKNSLVDQLLRLFRNNLHILL